MDRLTKIDGIGQNEIIKCFECGLERAGAELEHCGYCEHWQAVLDRLAALETIIFDTDDKEIVSIDRLRELVQADQKGQLPPVKCGDVLYETDPVHGIITHTIKEIGWFAHSDAVDNTGKSWWDHWGASDIGTAHKTREAAEKAQQEVGRAL